MKILVVSDLHVDINKCNYFGFMDKLDNVDLVLIAGDISGGYHSESVFLNKLKQLDKSFVVVAGNHLGYDYNKIIAKNVWGDVLVGTKDWSIQYLKKQCSNYLENEYIKMGDKIIFGATMYTDYKLYGNKSLNICKNTSERWLNDFRYVHTYDKKENIIRPITADDYINRFKLFKRKLNKMLKETTEDVIIVTHFAPSVKSISEKYLNQRPTLTNPGYYLNAVYASNLEKFIKDNPRIKLWAHGHVHDCFDYYIGDCRVVCHPYGYHGYEQSLKPEEYYGLTLNL